MTIIVSVTSPAVATLDGQTTTPRSIVKRAIRMLGQLTKGKDPTTSEYEDGLEALNAILDSWRNDSLMAFAMEEVEWTLDGSASYTIGPGADIDTSRPVRVENAVVVLTDGSVCGVRVVEDDEWLATNRVYTSDYPYILHYDATLPNGTISVAPIGGSGYSLRIAVRVPLYYFADIDTAYTLAPGWRDALATTLAIALGPEYETEAPPTVRDRAAKAVASIKNVNSRPLISYTELPYLVGRRQRQNIISGQ